MNKLYTLISAIFLSATISFGQISYNGTPYVLNHPEIKTEVVEIAPFTLEEQLKAIDSNEKNGTLYSIAEYLPVNKNNENSGSYTELANGDRLWTLTIQSKDALALGLAYDVFDLASGAKVFLYNKSRTQVLGAYTEATNPENRNFATELVQGDEVTIELFEPASAVGKSKISIKEVAYAYRDVHFLDEFKDFGDGEACMLNANCSEGDNFRDEQRGVARILVRAGSGAGWCSGSLINNTAEDCTPYFLTAAHCADGADEGDLNQWIFYFNYESPDCDNPSTQGSLATKTVVGCEKKTSNSTGDYYLVLLNSSPLAEWNPHYNGWNVSTSASSSGVSIHHPGGDIKKISTYTSSLTSSSWGGTPGTHWRVVWATTANGHSVTQGGSSGSPIFNANGEIVGMLTGGSSYCGSPFAPDLYGKMSYGWTSTGMKPWLDPTNSGVTSMDGSDVPCSNQPLYDIAIQEITDPDGTICGTSFTPKFKVKNNGFETITTFEIEYTVNGTTYNDTYNGELTTGETANVTLDAVTISTDGNYNFEVTISSPNGETDEDTGDNSDDVDFTMNADGEKLRLRIRKDHRGSELTWDVKDANGTIIQAGGPYNDGNMAWETEYICVDEGECFTLNMYDAGGDGICCDNGSGRYELQSPDGSVILAMGDGDYGSGETKNFCYITSVSAFEKTTSFNLYPVPANEQLNIEISMNDANEGQIYMINALGEVISLTHMSKTAYIKQSINTANLQAGVYAIVLQTNQGKITKTFTVVK